MTECKTKQAFRELNLEKKPEKDPTADIEYTEYLKGKVIRYLTRYPQTYDDLRSARKYLDKLISVQVQTRRREVNQVTNEEAIAAIKNNWPDERYSILREALTMAIEALKSYN